jgi:hypothetical protein
LEWCRAAGKPYGWISDMLLSDTVEAKHITAGAGYDGEGEREGEGGSLCNPSLPFILTFDNV